mgnify:CR=1 FL=1
MQKRQTRNQSCKILAEFQLESVEIVISRYLLTAVDKAMALADSGQLDSAPDSAGIC